MTRSGRGRRARLAVPAVLLAALVLAGCGDGTAGSPDTGTATGAATDATQTSPNGTATAQQVELDEILQNPTQYDEQRVTTTGVASQLAPNLLAVSPSGAAGGATGSPTGTQTETGTQTGDGENRLLVAYGQGLTPPQDGSTVTVTGTVQDSFDVNAIEQTLGITINEQLISTLGIGEDDVVLVADDVRSDTQTGGQPGTGGPSPTATTS